MEINACKQGSVTWKAIVHAFHFLREGFKMRLGNEDCSFWFDDWTSEGCFCQKVPYVHISDSDMWVRDVWRDGG